MATEFVDRATLHVTAGDGGHGVASIKREKFKPLGGPRRAATAGRVARSSCGSTRRRRRCWTTTAACTGRAANGKPGGGDERNGAEGDDLILPVPVSRGTVLKDLDGTVVVDLLGMGTEHIVASGWSRGWATKPWLAATQGARFRLARRAGRDCRHRA